jgi:hypothetical protein
MLYINPRFIIEAEVSPDVVTITYAIVTTEGPESLTFICPLTRELKGQAGQDMADMLADSDFWCVPSEDSAMQETPTPANRHPLACENCGVPITETLSREYDGLCPECWIPY